MELVAAAKMKRAVAKTLSSRSYALYSWEILSYLAKTLADEIHPLLREKSGNKFLVILITSNRGLSGAYNAQAIRASIAFVREHPEAEVDFIVVGKKGEDALRRTGRNIIASFTELPELVSLREVTPIANFAIDQFLSNNYAKAFFIYTDYVSALTQTAKVRQLLPISPAVVKEVVEDSVGSLKADSKQQEVIQYLFEPNYDILVKSMVEKIARMQVYQMFLESNASEQSSKMMAMKNASEAAGEMIDELTLAFNKARQASITQEISEISAGVASVS